MPVEHVLTRGTAARRETETIDHVIQTELEELEEYEETPDDEDEALEEDNAENDAYASEQVSAEDLDL